MDEDYKPKRKVKAITNRKCLICGLEIKDARDLFLHFKLGHLRYGAEFEFEKEKEDESLGVTNR